MDINELKLKLEIDYLEAKSKYDMEAELLRIKREQFYAENPNFPIKTMYMQVTSPPKIVIIHTIN